MNVPIASGSSAAVRSGPTGMPRSVDVSTSAASWASPCPSWLPNAMPPICPTIASIGPAAERTSSGSPSTQAADRRRATGSHSRFHVGMPALTQSDAVQATTSCAPAGNSVTGSSHSSASRNESCTAVRWASVSDDVVCESCWTAICWARS